MNKTQDILTTFVEIDQKMLDLQEKLCAAKLTHRADQVDILRRAMNTILYEASIGEQGNKMRLRGVKECGKMDGNYICNDAHGHKGPHTAWSDDSRIVHRWPLR